MNSKLWNSGLQSNKDLVSQKYKRKKNFVSNILVINDSGNPENNGKVFPVSLWDEDSSEDYGCYEARVCR